MLPSLACGGWTWLTPRAPATARSALAAFLLRALGCLLLPLRALGSVGYRREPQYAPPPCPLPCLHSSTSGSSRPASRRAVGAFCVPVLCLARWTSWPYARACTCPYFVGPIAGVHSFVDAVYMMQRAFFMANVGSVISILLRREIAIVASPPSWSGSLPLGTFVAHRIIPVGLGGVA